MFHSHLSHIVKEDVTCKILTHDQQQPSLDLVQLILENDHDTVCKVNNSSGLL